MPDPNRAPATRNLQRLVDAMRVTEDELGFQIMRLTDHVRPRTEEEAQYFEDLKAGYETSRKYVRTLLKYHEGRLDRLQSGDEGRSEPDPDAIDIMGRAAAYTGDEE